METNKSENPLSEENKKKSPWDKRKKKFKELGYWENIKEEIEEAKEELGFENGNYKNKDLFYPEEATRDLWYSGDLFTDDIPELVDEMRDQLKIVFDSRRLYKSVALAYLLLFVMDMQIEDLYIRIAHCNCWMKKGYNRYRRGAKCIEPYKYYFEKLPKLEKALKSWKKGAVKIRNTMCKAAAGIASFFPGEGVLIEEDIDKWIQVCLTSCMKEDNKKMDKYREPNLSS